MGKDPYRHAAAIERETEEQLVRGVLACELVPNEELLWVGRPKQGIRFGPLDIVLIPFSLLWGGGAIAWEVLAIWHGAPLFFVLFGIPVLLFGLYVIAGRFLVDARLRARTYYGVTDRRVLIVTRSRTRSLTAVDLVGSAEISLEEKADGTGTITLGRRNFLSSPQNAWLPLAQRSGRPMLWRVADARAVFKIIQATRQALRAKDRRNDRYQADG